MIHRLTRQNSRQVALNALREVHQKGAYTDIALDRGLRQSQLEGADRGLATELVYGCTRRMRSLDFLIDRLATKPASKQPPDVRIILHLGLYQLGYLSHIPDAAAVDTTVQLAKTNGFPGLAGFVNGVLRQYLRLKQAEETPDLPIPQSLLSKCDALIERLGVLHSYPDWMVELWLEQLGEAETDQLCQWFNRPPNIDLRINPLRTTLEAVEAAMQSAGVEVHRLPFLPQALRLRGSSGAIAKLPGFQEGWWVVQDSSAQLVGYLLDPQPHEVVIDACAAPGGKTTHIAELMGDRGTAIACDLRSSRLKKLVQTSERLGLESIQIYIGDIRDILLKHKADRVLLDAPCSGLGTLHRHPDARWRQTPASVQELATLQAELLRSAAQWVKPGGILVYSTCTLHPLENEQLVQTFLDEHPTWKIQPPSPNTPPAQFATPEGWVKVWPHRHNMDGFFMVRLKHVGEAGEEKVLSFEF